MTPSRLACQAGVATLLCLMTGTAMARDADVGDCPPQSATSASETETSEPASASSEIADPEPSGPVSPTAQREQTSRTGLNLLGQVDVEAGESRRNENVQISLIDNNVLKELNKRVGTTATIVGEFDPEKRYFGGEFGVNPTTPIHVIPATARGVHGNLFWGHNNSVFSARSFFQAGSVKPARENNYGVAFTVPVWKGGIFSFDGSQDKIRGNVNGNILVPRLDERTPLTTDPAKREYIEAILAAYPEELPNRTDINERALNTNAPQQIDNDSISGRLQQDISEQDRLILSYGLRTQRVEAFQLVGGQNPNTTTRSHEVRATWNRVWSPSTITDFTAGFDRVSTIILPDDSYPGVNISTGYFIERIGSSSVPIDRAQNQFRYGGRMQQTRGRHNWNVGFALMRRQVNGFEANSHLPYFLFRNNFGRDSMTNFLLGEASEYIISIGNAHRGYRNWETNVFIGDVWRVNRNLTLNGGLRYEPWTSPYEVDGLDTIPFGCDCNNFSPRFGFAYRLGDRLGVIRAAYGLHYGEMAPVMYSQERYNAPGNLRLTVQTPDLLNPLGDIDPDNFDPTTPATVFQLDPDLASPYSHQYNFSWELPLGKDWTVTTGYIGSRTHKIVSMWNLNRGRPVEGIPHITATVNERRPDTSALDTRRFLNGSRGYFDAAKVTLATSRWHRWTVDTSYWFSKAIDLGAPYPSTGTGRDGFNARGQSEFNVHDDMKGLSTFDQRHAVLGRVSYETPVLGGSSGWWKQVFENWRVSSVVLLKTGTPFTVRSGSDGPGFGNVDGASSDRPNVVDPSVLGRTIGHPDTSRELLPASAFGFIGPNELRGNLGSNTFHKDGISNVNAALSKNWPLGQERTLALRAEAINLFNHPQFAEPGRALTSPNFGQITNTLNDGRTFRFLLRFAF